MAVNDTLLNPDMIGEIPGLMTVDTNWRQFEDDDYDYDKYVKNNTFYDFGILEYDNMSFNFTNIPNNQDGKPFSEVGIKLSTTEDDDYYFGTTFIGVSWVGDAPRVRADGSTYEFSFVDKVGAWIKY